MVRLTAPDGYTASRSYSVASPPDGGNEIELTVERLDDGEVSTFLHDVLEVGDELEVRGPIGGYFVWDATTPALLLGGGSGIVPLMAMLRLARTAAPPRWARTRRPRAPAGVGAHARRPVLRRRARAITPTPPSCTRARRRRDGRDPAGRLTADDVVPHLRDDQSIYVCGSAPFTNAVGDLLVDLGVAPERAKFERFGPSATP